MGCWYYTENNEACDGLNIKVRLVHRTLQGEYKGTLCWAVGKSQFVTVALTPRSSAQPWAVVLQLRPSHCFDAAVAKLHQQRFHSALRASQLPSTPQVNHGGCDQSEKDFLVESSFLYREFRLPFEDWEGLEDLSSSFPHDVQFSDAFQKEVGYSRARADDF